MNRSTARQKVRRREATNTAHVTDAVCHDCGFNRCKPRNHRVKPQQRKAPPVETGGALDYLGAVLLCGVHPSAWIPILQSLSRLKALVINLVHKHPVDAFGLVISLPRLRFDGNINLGGGSQRSRKIRLGKLLAQRVDQVVGGFKIVDAGTEKRARQLRLQPLGMDGAPVL